MDEIREQEAKKEFEGVQVVKCPGCGADMAFDPELGALHCEYCDTVVKPEKRAADLSREKNVYIANMVKCRPPKNRDPKPEEQELCIDWLRAQFKAIRPRIIVCVGRISAQRLIGADFRVTKQHGEFVEKNGVLMMGTYHPAAILRNPNNKEAAFADWLAVRDKARELGIEL